MGRAMKSLFSLLVQTWLKPLMSHWFESYSVAVSGDAASLFDPVCCTFAQTAESRQHIILVHRVCVFRLTEGSDGCGMEEMTSLPGTVDRSSMWKQKQRRHALLLVYPHDVHHGTASLLVSAAVALL